MKNSFFIVWIALTLALNISPSHATDSEYIYLKDAVTQWTPGDPEEWIMIRDTKTGLTWERKMGSEDHNPASAYTFEQVSALMEKMNTESYGGISSWRLPTKNEIRTLVDYGAVMPAALGPFLEDTRNSLYWTSEMHLDNSWAMDFSDGSLDIVPGILNATYVRFVAGPKYMQDGSENFVSLRGGTIVLDLRTRLIWEVKTDDGSTNDKDNSYTWSEAGTTHIDKLNADAYGGFRNWRVPTLKELSAITDLSLDGIKIDEIIFGPTMKFFGTYTWTATEYGEDVDKAWAIHLERGSDLTLEKTLKTGQVRAVGGPVSDMDVTGDGETGLADAIVILKILANLNPSFYPAIFNWEGNVMSNNYRYGLHDVLIILTKLFE